MAGKKRRRRVMLPGEYMKTSLVEVWPRSALVADRPPFRGIAEDRTPSWEETRPDLYVVIVRRNDGDWHYEMLRAIPADGGVIPEEVFERLERMKKAIIKEERSDRGKQQAALRVVDGDLDEVYDADDEEVADGTA